MANNQMHLCFPLEAQVTSLEASKRLKELGVKQESLFYWSYYDGGATREKPIIIISDDVNRGFMEDVVSAFTASELGVMLPVEFHNSEYEKFGLRIWKDYDGQWFVVYFRSSDEQYTFLEFGTLADAMAKMLIHLLESGLLKVEEIGK